MEKSANVMTMETNNAIAQNELLSLLRKKAKKRSDYCIHLFVYGTGMTFWLLKNYSVIEVDFLPFRYINWFVMGFWTFAVAVQTVELLVGEFLFGKKWEEKKLRAMMRERSERQKWE